jgi:hypothetical protein
MAICPKCSHEFDPVAAPARAIPALPDAPKVPVGYKQVVATFGKPDLPGKTGNVPLAKARVPDVFKRLPYLANGTLTCHKLIKARVEWVFAELERRGLADLIKSYDGCYNPRPKRGGSDPSTHAWAIAIDINAGDNRMGAKPKIDRRIVAVFKEAEFVWGGDWASPDGMHFQYANFF